MKAAALLGLVVLSGCATGAGRAPGFLVRGLTYEGRLLLLDAEENYAAAAVRAEQAQLELDRAHAAVGEADARVALYPDPSKPWTKEAVAQRAYAGATEAWAAAAVEVAAADATCLRARYELSKVESAQKIQVAGAAEVDAEAWRSEAKDCEAQLDERRDALRGLAQQRARAKVDWDGAKSQLTRLAKHARPGPFVE